MCPPIERYASFDSHRQQRGTGALDNISQAVIFCGQCAELVIA